MRRVVTVFFGMLCLFLFLHAVDADAETAVGFQLSAVSQNFSITGTVASTLQQRPTQTP
jgi:hypothetical protein